MDLSKQSSKNSGKSNTNFNSDGSGEEASDEAEDRLSDDEGMFHDEEVTSEKTNGENSGMASVVARILSKDTSKSNRVLLAKGKTNNEILQDISRRKRLREGQADDGDDSDEDLPTKKDFKKEHLKEEQRKIWESMGRKIPSVLDNPRETKLRKIATQGMVQLFRSVNEHQRLLKDKLSTAGASEIKRDKVMSEFTKGKFLDLLKGNRETHNTKSKETGKEAKWKILQDDFMMGASMKDWDKEGSDGEGSAGDAGEPMDDDDLSDD